MPAYGYLRKSRVTSDRHVSWQVQEEQVRALASKHGDADLTLLSDWGVSGKSKARRPQYGELLRAIDAGHVSAIYGYSLSRLSRSLADYTALAERCRDHRIPIHLVKEGTQDYSTASSRFVVGILALFAQMELELASERATDVAALRRARGDRMGGPPYSAETAGLIASAFLEAGSYLGAARLLNARHVRTLRGGLWHPTIVKGVIVRHAPHLIPAGSRRGARTRGQFRLYGLLRCPCGRLMVAMRSHGATPGYLCMSSKQDPTHPTRRYIAEARVLPFIEAELAHLRMPTDVQVIEHEGVDSVALETQRLRVADNYQVGAITIEQRDARLAAIEAELAKGQRRTRMLRIGPIDLGSDPAKLNDLLRSIFESVQLGPDLLPLPWPEGYTWAVPEWRA